MAGFNQWMGIASLTVFLCLTGCKKEVLNSPHSNTNATDKVIYSAFTERPKTLDPARSYSAEEAIFTGQIYEPPLQYSYLLRPYQLVPQTVTQIPIPEYYNQQHQRLSEHAASEDIAYSIYTIHLKHGIYYQPHPAFVKNSQGEYEYDHLSKKQIEAVSTLADFQHTATKELTADDYVYEIKRLASPKVQSPIAELLSGYILGMNEYTAVLQQQLKQHPSSFLDLRQYPLAGAVVVDPYTYQIIIKGKYPQFIYWLAMNFFAPLPWEADHFYSQPGLSDKNITLDWYPVGTGPYWLKENNPNRQMVLQQNPNYHEEYYPTKGTPEDEKAGFLKNAGKRLPLTTRYVYSLEKESIPYWNKFLQGYYDRSGISADSYDQAIQVTEEGELDLSPHFKETGIHLNTSTEPALFYFGFNMLDPVVGGYSAKAIALRQGISIALNMEEYISIFLNGRGVPAQGPIPPGIFGHEAGKKGINPYVYEWQNEHARRRSLEQAKALLVKAGYPNGRNAVTGKPLIINYDAVSNGNPDERAMMDWIRKQFKALNIQLYVRPTTYNRFQEKIRTGNAQLFSFGWSADYPDPENFLFLLYGPNSKVKQGGENATNYSNPEYDQLFLKMKTMVNTPERLRIIEKMVDIVRRDSPWIWGFYPKTFVLSHQWVGPIKPNVFAKNTLKYVSVEPSLRQRLQIAWNQPIFWPIWLGVSLILLVLLPVFIRYRTKQHSSPKRLKDD